LRDWDRALARIGVLLTQRFGPEAAGLTGEARHEYSLLIPAIPDLGGRQPFTQFLTAAAWFLAMHRVLRRRGASTEEVGQLVYDSTRAFLDASPRFARRLLGYVTFSPRYLRRLRQRAQESQARRGKGDYVFTYVEGEPGTFTYGVDYAECASCAFLAAHGAPELAPYLCAVDQLYSDMLGWGLKRTTTLAEGGLRCDFRFRRGGATELRLPPSLTVA
jgi:hypothetical protein